MHTFMFGLVLLASALASPDDKQKPGGREGADRQAMSGPQIDGTWTVVAMERLGQPAAAGANTTVTIRNNVVTFGGMTGSGAAKSDAGRAGAPVGRTDQSRLGRAEPFQFCGAAAGGWALAQWRRSCSCVPPDVIESARTR